jgi:hypothetical protein
LNISKPGLDAVTVYFPGVSSVMLKNPAEVVVRLVETPVLTFVAVTVA